jgi:hypothetical protein
MESLSLNSETTTTPLGSQLPFGLRRCIETTPNPWVLSFQPLYLPLVQTVRFFLSLLPSSLYLLCYLRITINSNMKPN